MGRALRGAIVAVALCALPVAAFAIETIPFTDDGGLIHVRASVDGQSPVSMLVDLGAGVDILSERLAHLVDVDGKYTTMRLTGQRLDLPRGKVVSITLGNARIGERTVGVWNGLYRTLGVDGILSAEAFRDTATTIDFRNKQIIIEDAVTFPERKRTATYVPLLLQDDMNTALAIFARFDVGNGRSALCEIDTGRKDIVFDNVFAAKGIPSLELDGAPQTAIKQPPVKFDNLIYDCMVGNDFWGGRTISLDTLNHALWVQQQL